MRKGVFSYVKSLFATFSPFGGFFAIRQDKMSGEDVGEGWGRKECRDPENQFSFIRKTYKQLIIAIVQVVETFLNIRIRFQSDFNNILTMMCDGKVDCCNLSPIPMFYSVNWIAIFSKIML